MGARQKRWAKSVRDDLFDVLGRRCAWCGGHGEAVKLTFDVKLPTESGGPDGNGHHRKMDWSHRMSFYRRQHDAGNLQVLCDRCNTKKSNSISDVKPELNWAHCGELQPF